MAEFMEVMGWFEKMYERNRLLPDCGDCALGNGPVSKCRKMLQENPEECERVKYPTWKEWSKQMFPKAMLPIRPCEFEDISVCVYNSCDECRGRHIPADIAKKLGINPIPVEPKKTFVDEYERLRDRVANLNLYLEYARKNYPAVFNALEKRFSGLPGFERVEG